MARKERNCRNVAPKNLGFEEYCGFLAEHFENTERGHSLDKAYGPWLAGNAPITSLSLMGILGLLDRVVTNGHHASVLHTARFDLAPCWHYLSVAPGRGNQERCRNFTRSATRHILSAPQRRMPTNTRIRMPTTLEITNTKTYASGLPFPSPPLSSHN